MATSPFTLAACAEMLCTHLRMAERVRRIDALGFDVGIWRHMDHDVDAQAVTGATFSSMTGYVEGNLVDPAGADALIATARNCIAVAAHLGCPRLNLRTTGLGADGLPVHPVACADSRM